MEWGKETKAIGRASLETRACLWKSLQTGKRKLKDQDVSNNSCYSFPFELRCIEIVSEEPATVC